MQVLLVNTSDRIQRNAAKVLEAMEGSVATTIDYREAAGVAQSGTIDAVIVTEPACAGVDSNVGAREDFANLMRIIEAERIAALIVGDRAFERKLRSRSLVGVVDAEVTTDELRGRLATILRYQSLVGSMEHELRNMERMGKRLNQHFNEVDQEMRLASRLQREFLPDVKKPIGNVQFAAVYRPASWVSGDIYGIFRVDEEHIGFYLADAVGHGMAASLLTMFINRAIVPKRIYKDHYEVCSPSETMQALNDALAEQALPHCQFVTAFYGLLNTSTLQLQYARGGHPYPVLIAPDGSSAELKSPGGLLGLFKGEEFPTLETQMHPGDKLILFSDGVENVFQADDSDSLNKTAYRKAFESLAHQPIKEMMMHIEALLDTESGSITPRDDVTVVGLEILDS